MEGIKLRKLGKSYDGKSLTVKNVDLDIKDREFIVLVGPSGCGKSTILRMIAGLEDITEGQIYINGDLVNEKEPKDRDIAMVFQNYALYPSMTVYENIAFSLKLSKLPKAEIKEKVNLTAKKLQLEDLLDRKPKHLSGGQRQRVALGRALVRNPKAFLLDEPLSNLDAKLRTELRSEIIKLHKDIDTTFIYVTHDQVEAMTMADRIVVLKDGEIQQVDTPRNIYLHPQNKFVAEFIGSPSMNFFDAKLRKDSFYYASIGDYRVEFKSKDDKNLDKYIGQDIILGVRPEDVTISKRGIKTTLLREEMLGSQSFVYVQDTQENTLIVEVQEGTNLDGENLFIKFKEEKVHIFDKKTQDKIY